MGSFSDLLRLRGRQTANRLIAAMPRALVRQILKSYWQQPRLQDRLEFHVEPYRYESAIPTSKDVDRQKLSQRRNLPGISFSERAFLELLAELERYAAELAGIPVERTAGAEFWWHNGGFEDFDAITLYTMLRHLKPRRVIEVGCGFSSRVIAEASRRNAADGAVSECLFIEPYLPEALRRNPLPGRVMEKKIQEVPLSTFDVLESGDVLFIDTTHVVKAQSDCVYELLEILPRLKPGVRIHIHDIFTPFDYPAEWLLDHLRPFNEQYALECLLTHSHAFEVVLPVYFLFKCHQDRLSRLLPHGRTRPASFWIQRIGSLAEASA